MTTLGRSMSLGSLPETSSGSGAGSSSVAPTGPPPGSPVATVGDFIDNTKKCDASDFKIVSKIAKALENKENKKKYLEKMDQCKKTYLEALETDSNAGDNKKIDELLNDVDSGDKEDTKKFMDDLKVEGQLAKFQQYIETEQSEKEMKKEFDKRITSTSFSATKDGDLDSLPTNNEKNTFIKGILTVDGIHRPLSDTFTVDEIYRRFKEKYSKLTPHNNKTELLKEVAGYTNYHSIKNDKFNEIYNKCSTKFTQFIKTNIFNKLQPAQKNSFFDKEENATKFVKLFLDEYFRDGLDDFVNNIQTIINSYQPKLAPISNKLVQPYSLTRLVKKINSLPGFEEDSFLISPGFNPNTTTIDANTNFGFIKKVTPADGPPATVYKIELENKTADTSNLIKYITHVTLGIVNITELKALDNKFFNDGTGFKLFSDIKKEGNDILDEIISKLLKKEPIAKLYIKGKNESKNYESMVFLLKDIIEMIRLNNKPDYPKDEIEKLKSVQQDIRSKGTPMSRNVTDNKLKNLEERTKKINDILEFNTVMPTDIEAIKKLIADNNKIIDTKKNIKPEDVTQDEINGKKLERILKLIEIKNKKYTFQQNEGEDGGYIRSTDANEPKDDDLKATPPEKNNMLNNIKLLGPDNGINSLLIKKLKDLQKELKKTIEDFDKVPDAPDIEKTYVELDTSAAGTRLGRKLYQKKLGNNGVKDNYDAVNEAFSIVKLNNMKDITKNGINSKYLELETVLKLSVTDNKVKGLKEKTEKIKNILNFSTAMPKSIKEIEALIADNNEIIKIKKNIKPEDVTQDEINGKKLERILKLIKIKNKKYTFEPDEGKNDGYIRNTNAEPPKDVHLTPDTQTKNNMLNNINLLGRDNGRNKALIEDLKKLQQELGKTIEDFADNKIPQDKDPMIDKFLKEDKTRQLGRKGKRTRNGENYKNAEKTFLTARDNKMQNITENSINSKFKTLREVLNIPRGIDDKLKIGGAILTGGKYTRKNKNIRKRSRKMKPKMKVSRKNKFNSKKNTKKNAKKYAKKKTKKRSRKIYKISRNSKKRSRKSMNY